MRPSQATHSSACCSAFAMPVTSTTPSTPLAAGGGQHPLDEVLVRRERGGRAELHRQLTPRRIEVGHEDRDGPGQRGDLERENAEQALPRDQDRFAQLDAQLANAEERKDRDARKRRVQRIDRVVVDARQVRGFAYKMRAVPTPVAHDPVADA